MTRWIVPLSRRIVQLGSLLLLIALPLFSLYVHYDSAHALADLPEGQWRTAALQSIEQAIGERESRQRWVDQTQGTFWSARIAGWELSDPLAGAETMASSWSLAGKEKLFWSLLIPVAATLLLGRFFCGWICPMNTLLELVDKGRRVLRWAEIRERDIRFSRRNKYVVLGLCLGFLAVVQRPFLALVYPPAVISREMHRWVFESTVGMGALLILVVCAFELLVSRRWWCRYICPGGALYSLLGRLRLVRIRRVADKCIECGDCVRICQFDLRPMLVETTGMECTNCGSCISGCDSDALRYSLVLPLAKSQGQNHPPANNALPTDSQPAVDAKGNASTAMKSIVAAMLIATSLSPPAQAHHILGLPHYSYKENYPQAPTLEYPATTGPYDVLMTSYPGKPVPGEAASVAFYIKDRHSNEPYANPITVRVLQTFTFGENAVIHPPTTHAPYDNQHKYTVTFPEDSEYMIELTMDVEGQTEVIPFLIVAGEPTATGSVLVAIGGGLAFFLIVVRAIKVKRERRRAGRQTTEPATVKVEHPEPGRLAARPTSIQSTDS